MRKIMIILLIVALALTSGCGKKKKQTEKPLAPTNLTAVGTSYDQIRLAWQDRSDNEQGFKIYCSAYMNGYYSLIGAVSANTTAAVHYDLDPLSSYYYYISAYNRAGANMSNYAGGITQSGIKILSQNLGEKYDDACLKGQARNITNIMLDSVTLTAWFYDSNGVLLQTANDYGFDIPAQTTWNYEIWAYNTELARVARYDLEVSDVDVWRSEKEAARTELDW